MREAEEFVFQQGAKLFKLYNLKRLAVENEDYATAKKIKEHISDVEYNTLMVDPETGEIPDEINPRVLTLNPSNQKTPLQLQQELQQSINEKS